MPAVRSAGVAGASFRHFSGTQSIFSEGITSFIYMFFCLDAKEHINKQTPRSASLEKCKKESRRSGAHCIFYRLA